MSIDERSKPAQNQSLNHQRVLPLALPMVPLIEGST